MSKIKDQVYLSILKTILACCSVYLALSIILNGICIEAMAIDSFYLVLIMFLRSSAVSPVWRLTFKWTLLVSIPIEAIMYGGGSFAHLVAILSFCRYIFNYGFVLYWNPVLKKKDTLPNRLVELTLSSFFLCLLTPLKLQTFLVQVALSIHTFWCQTKIVQDVCTSGVLDDAQAVLSEIPSDPTPDRPPIEVWMTSYHSAVNKRNILPQEVIDQYLVQSCPWQLRRLIVRSLVTDPTRLQMKSLLMVGSSQPVGMRSTTLGKASLISKGPLALVCEESNERVVVNEAINSLSVLLNQLGEKRFVAAFEKSTDGKAALDIVKGGYK